MEIIVIKKIVLFTWHTQLKCEITQLLDKNSSVEPKYLRPTFLKRMPPTYVRDPEFEGFIGIRRT